ncbi:hypothetical protein KFF05_08170 [bacterium SCSIO 12827]|nr:hypothetical protein KFF05_08170 [bacterium SCSIO 12827]
MSEHQEQGNSARRYWLDDQKNVRKIIITLFIVCGLLFLADGFYEKHSHFGFEDVFGFYAIYGFVMCVILVLAAKVMRIFLMRDEDYYDRDQ